MIAVTHTQSADGDVVWLPRLTFILCIAAVYDGQPRFRIPDIVILRRQLPFRSNSRQL